ncbi:MAG: hypothetical protein QW416_05845 [Candidatus Nitrosocaldaceae archaeon]
MDKRLALAIIVLVAVSATVNNSFAQIPEDKHVCIIDGCNLGESVDAKVLDRHQYSWNVFYKMMTAAFIVGAVVQGVLVFVTFRFREKRQKEVKK